MDKQSATPAGYGGEYAFSYDDQRFSTRQGLLFDALEQEQVARAAASLPAGATVLEVGCGTARFSRKLAEKQFSIVATDTSADMLKVAEEKCRGFGNVAFQQADGRDLRFGDDAFDFVFAVRVLNQTGSNVYALETAREMLRVAKPGGVVLVEFPNRNRPFRRIKDQIRFSYEEMAEFAAKNGANIVWGSGVVMLSQSIMDRIPAFLLPVYGLCERAACRLFWRHASRIHVLMRKKPPAER